MIKSNPLSAFDAFLCQLCHQKISMVPCIAKCCNKLIGQNCQMHICSSPNTISLGKLLLPEISKQQTLIASNTINCQRCDESFDQLYSCLSCQQRFYESGMNCERCFNQIHQSNKFKHHKKKLQSTTNLSKTSTQINRSTSSPYKQPKQNFLIKVKQIIKKSYIDPDNVITLLINKNKTKFNKHELSVSEIQSKWNKLKHEYMTQINKIMRTLTQKMICFEDQIKKRKLKEIESLKENLCYQKIVEQQSCLNIIQIVSKSKQIPHEANQILGFMQQRLEQALDIFSSRQNSKIQIETEVSIITQNFEEINSSLNKLQFKKAVFRQKNQPKSSLTKITSQKNLNSLNNNKTYMNKLNTVKSSKNLLNSSRSIISEAPKMVKSQITIQQSMKDIIMNEKWGLRMRKKKTTRQNHNPISLNRISQFQLGEIDMIKSNTSIQIEDESDKKFKKVKSKTQTFRQFKC